MMPPSPGSTIRSCLKGEPFPGLSSHCGCLKKIRAPEAFLPSIYRKPSQQVLPSALWPRRFEIRSPGMLFVSLTKSDELDLNRSKRHNCYTHGIANKPACGRKVMASITRATPHLSASQVKSRWKTDPRP